MRSIPAQLSHLLEDLTTGLPLILGRNLVGIYLHGSVTQRSFNPKRSDVDCIVVTRQELSDAQFKKLGAWLARTAKINPWTTRLQMLFLIKNEALTMNSRACLYQFGIFKRTGSDGNPIIWMEAMDTGAVLLGPRPESFVPEITREILFQALERELGYLRDEINSPESEWRKLTSYRAYAVLTVCRILYSFRKGTIVPKQRAARWAAKYFCAEWNDIIHQAIEISYGQRSPPISLSRIRRFINFASVQLGCS
jgi:hypothetical protein